MMFDDVKTITGFFLADCSKAMYELVVEDMNKKIRNLDKSLFGIYNPNSVYMCREQLKELLKLVLQECRP